MNTKGKEIERKWLIKGKPTGILLSNSWRLSQGYLPINIPAALRLRKTEHIRDSKKTTEEYIFTLKMGSGIIKDELEEKIDKKLFNKLWACCGENIVEKDRIFYEHLNGFVSEVGFVAEVDIYKGKLKGLKTVEVEFDGLSEANLFYPPSWFGKEVTNDNRYSNFNLSKSRFDKVTGELIE